MSNMKHQVIYQVLDVQMADEDFQLEMNNGLANLIDTANDIGFHIDWSTLRIREAEKIEIANYTGELVDVYSTGITLTVDTIKIEEGE